VFGVGVASRKSAGSRNIHGFFFILIVLRQPFRKKDAPLHALGGRIVTLAETQLSALGEIVCFALNG